MPPCFSLVYHYKANRICSLVPVNLKDQDAFHLTIEEYLLALIAMVEELVRVPVLGFHPPTITNFAQSRLAVNSVTLGDYTRPMQIGNFIKELFAGFQLLNLKNDILRKRSDGIKYSVCCHRSTMSTLLF
jgi:hypothetical protein